ncbi:MAG: hypothetical protein FJ291_23705 [Planctomycetes bacterium]|nr:hypothetical protein [Planctomycetota bacterium]
MSALRRFCPQCVTKGARKAWPKPPPRRSTFSSSSSAARATLRSTSSYARPRGSRPTSAASSNAS